MTIHKQRATDRGAAHAGSKDRPKLKPRAYISRNVSGNYEIRAESGYLIDWAIRYVHAHEQAISLGFVPIRNKHGDAPKTK